MGSASQAEHVEEYAELLVREYLRGKRYTKTLAALNAEKSEKGLHAMPTPESWFSISEAIDLAGMLLQHRRKNATASHPASIIEVLTDALLNDVPRPSSKIPTARSNKGVRAGQSTSEAAEDAIFVDGASSMSSNTAPPTNRRAAERPATADASTFRSKRGLGKSRGGNRSDVMLLSRILKLQTRRKKRSRSPVNHHGTTTRPRSQPTSQISSTEKPFVRRMYRPEEVMARKTMMLLERNKSPEFWIPIVSRHRMLERGLNVLKRNLDAQKITNDAIHRYTKWYHLTELDHNKAQERLGSKHQMRCALCEFLFSEVNLKLVVPYKAIVDLRMLWRAEYPNRSEGLGPTTHVRPPMCYDKVGVCSFCAQFFLDQDKYRPAIDWAHEEERRVLLKELEEHTARMLDPLKTMEEAQREELAAEEAKFNMPPLRCIPSTAPAGATRGTSTLTFP